MTSIDLSSLSSVVFNGIEVDVLQLNGNEIWARESKDTYILNVSSVAVDDFTGIDFGVTIGEGGATATFNGQSLTLDSAATSAQFLTDTANVTGNVIFKGDLIKVATNTPKVDVNYIVQLDKNKTSLYENQFVGQTIDFDVDIPSVYTTINMNAFSSAVQAIKNFGSGKLNFGTNIQKIVGLSGYGYYSNFFSNATNNGSVWSVNDCVFATSVASSSLKEVTIPNGTRLMATYLFAQKGFDHSSMLETINLPTDNTLEDIPDSFCEDCATLHTISAIPSSVKRIGQKAFAHNDGTMSLTSLTFNQPSGMYVELPTAGSSTGMLHVKTAREMTIYTDNEYIKNYNYASDNITATILHLDGSAWE